MPLFLFESRHIKVPLEATYQTTWSVLPRDLQVIVETGVMPAEEWSSIFTVVDDDGRAVPPNDLPLMITLTKRRPAYSRFFIKGLDGVVRHVEVAAIPISGLQDEFLGAAAMFWEVPE